MISWQDFKKVEMCCGTIIEAKDFINVKKSSYLLTIDFDEAGIKTSSVQIIHHYTKSALINKQVIAVINFPVKQIVNFFSECFVPGVYDEDNNVVLLRLNKK